MTPSKLMKRGEGYSLKLQEGGEGIPLKDSKLGALCSERCWVGREVGLRRVRYMVGQDGRIHRNLFWPATVKRWKLAWFGHDTHHDSLSKTILRGTLEGGRRRGRQRKCRMENAKERTYLPMPELLTRASCRKHWKRISAESSLMSPR